MGILDGIISGYTEAILGPDPNQISAAYKGLQDSINSRYDVDKQKFEADPANSGKSYQLPDPVTRWQHQIDGMITSGNPTLQQEGLRQLSQYHQRATAATTNEAPASVKEFQYAQANGFGGSYTDWKQLNKAGGTSVDVHLGGQQGVQGINFLTKEEKEQLHLPQNTAYYVDKNGQIKEPPGGSDIATQQQTNVTNSSVDESERLMFGQNGIFDTTKKEVDKFNVPKVLQRPAEAAYAFSQQYLQNDPRYAQQDAINSNLASTIGRAYLGEKGVMTDEDTTRIRKLLPDPVRDNKETARMKMNYIKKIIDTSDPTKAREMVYGGSKPSVSKGTDAAVTNATSTKPTPRTLKVGDKTYKYTIEK